MCLGEGVADHQTVGLFEFSELDCLRREVICQFGNAALLKAALHLCP
jgi:hypothetical protein